MRESSFVQNNKDQWNEIEQGLLGKTDNPELLRQQFIKVTDDLAYARTFYQNRSIRVYLNSLAQGVQEKLLKMRTSPKERIKKFWTFDVPLALFETRKLIYISYLIFFICVGFGVISTYESEEFPRAFFGDAYVDETISNIESGDPLGIYKNQAPLDMFVTITLNNLQVAFLAFGLGILFSVGSVYILGLNSIMLGTFMFFFYSRGFSYEFNSVVWLHGTFEILSMVVECAAGMVLGNSLIFPGTYTRSQSLYLAGKRGITIMMACVPVIIIAGFIEGYITRHTDMPDAIQWIIIGLSFVIFVYYFLVYPYLKFRNKDIELIKENQVVFQKNKKISWREQSSLMANISDTLTFLSVNRLKVMRYTILMATLLFCINLFTKNVFLLDQSEYAMFKGEGDLVSSFGNILTQLNDLFLPFYFGDDFSSYTLLNGLFIFLWSGLAFLVIKALLHKEDVYERSGLGALIISFVAGILFSITISLLCYLGGFGVFLAVLFLPVVLYVFIQLSLFKGGGFLNFGAIIKYHFFRIMGTYVLGLIIVLCLYSMVFSPLFLLFFNFFEWFFPPEVNGLMGLNYILLGIHSVLLSFSLILYLVMCHILVVNLHEFATANDLYKRIENLGLKKLNKYV